MNKAILLALLAGGALTGCVGVVGPGYYDEEPGYYEEDVPGPDLFIFGGFGRDRDRDFGHRGAESRRAAGHFGGPSGGGHPGGGHPGGGHPGGGHSSGGHDRR